MTSGHTQTGADELMPRSRLRVALYSHDTMGMGHMRRSTLLAHAFTGAPISGSVLHVAGAREAGAIALPPGADSVTLPALQKRPDRRYEPRRLAGCVESVIALRSQIILAALQSFDPDVLVVDNVPRGAMRELEPALAALRLRGHTRCVLGLRDILDEPSAVSRDWSAARNEEAILDYYDAVWVYGDPSVYDLVNEYGFAAEVAAKVHYVGYLDQRYRRDGTVPDDVEGIRAILDHPGPVALCVLGGGEDGDALAESFVDAPLPPGTLAVVVAGPYLSAGVFRRLQHRAASRPALRVLRFLSEPGALVERADCVVAMGGYNTVCELLSYNKRALLVPRAHPRREQTIRAERLQALGLVDVLHGEKATPSALGRWMEGATTRLAIPRRTVAMDGLSRIPSLLADIMSADTRSAHRLQLPFNAGVERVAV